jgi:hypothetical protein
LMRKDQQNCIRSALVVDRDGQDSKRYSTVPLWEASVPQHAGKEHIPPLFHGTQCPESASTLYLPDKSLAWLVAFSTSQGEEPHVLNMGWHLVSPRKPVFRYRRDERELALALSSASQNSKTAVLAMVFTCSLVGCEDNQAAGCGSPYWRQSCLNLQNQDLEEELADDSTLRVCLARMLSPLLSLQSWPNKENILRCSWACMGRHPARRKTTGAGVH